MIESIPDNQIANIIKNMSKKSKSFKEFFAYANKNLELKEKPIHWLYDPELLVADGKARPPRDIVLRIHPSELNKNNNFFLIAHEIGHLIQFEKYCPPIRFRMSNMGFRGEDEKQINGLLNSMIFDFSVNVKLQEYGIKIPFPHYGPPEEKDLRIFNLGYIFRYVLFQRYSLQVDEENENDIRVCLEKYQNSDLVTVGNRIVKIINNSTLTGIPEKINKSEVKSVLEEIFVNLENYFTKSPYEDSFKIIVHQEGSSQFLIQKTEI